VGKVKAQISVSLDGFEPVDLVRGREAAHLTYGVRR
jgi:hypothetical protein